MYTQTDVEKTDAEKEAFGKNARGFFLACTPMMQTSDCILYTAIQF